MRLKNSFNFVTRSLGVIALLLALPTPSIAQSSLCISEFLRTAPLGIDAPEASELINEVASSIGLIIQVRVIPCRFSEKASAFMADGTIDGIPADQYVIYNPDWVREVIGKDKIQAIALFGHEIGHFLNQHFTFRKHINEVQKETEADQFAGCAVARMNGSWESLEGLLSRLRKEKEQDVKYPNRLASLEAARVGFTRCGAGLPMPAPKAAIVADPINGLFCAQNEVRTPRISFFDYVTFGLKSCTPGNKSATRTFLARYPEEGSRSLNYVKKEGYEHCFVSDFAQKAPLVTKAIQAFATANANQIPCEITSSVTRLMNVSYIDSANNSKTVAFAQTYSPESDRNIVEQIPVDSAARSEHMAPVSMLSDFTFRPTDLIEQIRAFNFEGVPRIEAQLSQPTVATFTSPGPVVKAGQMSAMRVTLIDNSPLKKADLKNQLIFEYTWTGSGGTWRGAQTATVFLKGPGGATLQTIPFLIDRGGCYYGGGVRQTREAPLTAYPGLVSGFEVTLSEAPGGTPC